MFGLPYNKFQKVIEIITLVLILCQIAYTAVSYPQLSSKIPTHFNLAGEVDGWGGKGTIIILVVATVALYILLTVSMFFPKMWNVPVKITDQNRAIVFKYVMNMILLDKVLIVICFFYMTYCSISSISMGWWFTPFFLISVLGVTFYYTIKLFFVK
ncbi:DUF1648 domain-containing protein [Intestinibacter sp.]